MIPVSYTHLDVYKRQAKNNTKIHGTTDCTPELNNTVPVPQATAA